MRLMRRLCTFRAKAEEFDSSSSESAHTRSSHSKVEIDSHHGEITAAQDAAEHTRAEIYLVQTKPATEQTEDILLRAELADNREKLRVRELNVQRLELRLEQKTSEAADISRKLSITNHMLAELALKNERLETKVESAATWHMEVHDILGKSRRQASKLAYSNKMLTDSNNALININKELSKQLIIEKRKVRFCVLIWSISTVSWRIPTVSWKPLSKNSKKPSRIRTLLRSSGEKPKCCARRSSKSSTSPSKSVRLLSSMRRLLSCRR
ncbi:hypothetical protein BX661DRAFT_56067 [Kickxella alabastrina]|uniref:uncharacterized protein n=1 Tax=Kickxella alabastrina TaxID=61397 RepID=UPI00221ED148|nr:uncharacterized protein BX661DRAFT_56067 [Kickxella alabastrina]KAI7823460.1 hypothetical protein BX661DRAFT_56067 [Kickxella alabastrina]